MIDLSIVVETDNAGKTSTERAVRLLAELRAQLAERQTRAEILMMHDPARVSRSAIDALIAQAGLDGREPEVHVHAAPGKRYYEMKNEGAAIARGDIVLIIDSDIVPEPGFLDGMIAPFSDPEIAIVTGSPYVDTGASLLARASALYWMFQLRPTDAELMRSHDMMANTLAARRQVFLDHPFPESDGYRAQTGMLARELRRAGISVWRASRARAKHPPPENLRAAAARALWEGHDRFVDRPSARQRPAKPAKAVRGFVTSARAQSNRFGSEWRHAGIAPWELPFALALGLGYEALVRVGFAASWHDRKLLARFLDP